MGATEGWLAVVVWLLTYAVHSTLLLGAAWLVTGGLPERLRPWRSLTPRWNERVWKLALVGGLVTASAQQAADLEPFTGRWTVGGADPVEDVVALHGSGSTHAAQDRDATGTPSPRAALGAFVPGLGAWYARPGSPATPASEEVERRGEIVFEVREPELFLPRDDTFALAAAPPFELPAAGGSAQPAGLGPGTARSRFTEARTPRERFAALVPEEGETTAEPVRQPAALERAGADVARNRASGNRLAGNRRLHAAPLPLVGHVVELRAEVGECAPAAAVPAAGTVTPRPGVTLSSSWSRAGIGLWIAGAVCGLLAFALSWSRLLVRLAGRHELVAGPLRSRLDELCRKAGFRGHIRLTASRHLRTPVTLGLLRREICVPLRVLRDLDGVQQEALLAHELAHAIRRDPAWLGLCGLLETLLFVQPLNRLARRRLQHEAEFLCDDWAVRVTGRALPLASCLTAVAQWMVGERRSLPAPGMVDRSSGLRSRVERLLDGTPGAPASLDRAAALWAPSAVGILALVVLAIPGFARTTAHAVPASGSRTAGPAPEDAELHVRVLPADHGHLRADRSGGPSAFSLRTEAPAVALAHFLPDPTLAGEDAPARLLVVRARSLRDEQARVDALVEVVGAELELLEAELGAVAEGPAFEPALHAIEVRVDELRARRDRLNELLPRVLGILAASEETETRIAPEPEDRP